MTRWGGAWEWGLAIAAIALWGMVDWVADGCAAALTSVVGQ